MDMLKPFLVQLCQNNLRTSRLVLQDVFEKGGKISAAPIELLLACKLLPFFERLEAGQLLAEGLYVNAWWRGRVQVRSLTFGSGHPARPRWSASSRQARRSW